MVAQKPEEQGGKVPPVLAGESSLVWLAIKARAEPETVFTSLAHWLNAGVVEGDDVTYPEKGTPQGGVISTVLSNIFLHEVLDDWFIKEVEPRM